MVLPVPPPPTQVQHLLIHFHLVELYYHTGVWEFQVQPITFSKFRKSDHSEVFSVLN